MRSVAASSTDKPSGLIPRIARGWRSQDGELIFDMLRYMSMLLMILTTPPYPKHYQQAPEIEEELHVRIHTCVNCMLVLNRKASQS